VLRALRELRERWARLDWTAPLVLAALPVPRVLQAPQAWQARQVRPALRAFQEPLAWQAPPVLLAGSALRVRQGPTALMVPTVSVVQQALRERRELQELPELLGP
jgi:hypothetical protein